MVAKSEVAVRNNRAEKIRKLAIYMLENPTMTREEIGLAMGIPYQSLCALIRDTQLLQAIKGAASKAVLGMIPLAVKGFEDSLKSENDKIKYFASKDLLQTEKILGAERVDITINDNSQRTVEELQDMIKEAQKIPPPTIDAEIIQ